MNGTKDGGLASLALANRVVALPGADAPVKRGREVNLPPKAAVFPYAPGALAPTTRLTIEAMFTHHL